MTVLKFITCEVPANQKVLFSKAQRAWHPLSRCKGFNGQLGGWESGRSTAAVIGLWESHDDIAEFMSTVHDEIVDSSKQHLTYTECSVDYFTLESINQTAKPVMPEAALLQVIRCTGVLDQGRLAKSLAQFQIAEASMQASLPSCNIWRSCTNENHYLILIYWLSVSDYEKYADSSLLDFKSDFCPADDQSCTETAVIVEKRWQVTPEVQSSI